MVRPRRKTRAILLGEQKEELVSESATPRPGPRPDPQAILESLDELERDEQIAALEAVHAELSTRLRKAQA